MGFVYILQSEVNGRFYIGSTNNLEKRIQEHNSGQSKYTKLTKPFRLVFNQSYPTLGEARSTEYKLKKLKSRVVIERIIQDGKITLGISK